MTDCNGAGQWGKAWRAAKASAFFGLLNCPNLSAEKRSKNQSATQLIHLNLTKSEKIPGNDLRDFEILRMSTEASATQSTRSTANRDGRDSWASWAASRSKAKEGRTATERGSEEAGPC